MTHNRVDLHVHSDFSDGTSTIQDIVKRARTIGLECVAIADHFWPSMGSHRGGLSVVNERHNLIMDMQNENSELKILEGVEVDINSNGTLAPVSGGHDQFDIIIGSVHWGSDSARWASAVVRAAKSGLFQILAHFDGYLSSYRQEDGERVVEALVENNIAVELNGRYPPEYIEFIETARKSGCKFSIGSDSHSLHTIGQISDQVKLGKAMNLEFIEIA
ncbi:MAG: PHP domain-containing protein [Candidatus Thorarchaeota archaeon]|jgi:histidinol phosphatase-like PHP family hydrolase